MAEKVQNKHVLHSLNTLETCNEILGSYETQIEDRWYSECTARMIHLCPSSSNCISTVDPICREEAKLNMGIILVLSSPSFQGGKKPFPLLCFLPPAPVTPYQGHVSFGY